MSTAQKPTARTGPELQDALLQLEAETRIIHAQLLDLINEMRRRNLAKEAGYPSEQKLLTHLLRISPRKAWALVKEAELVAATNAPDGLRAPATLPVVRKAPHEGVLDPEHVEVIAAAVHQVPDWAGARIREVVKTASGRHRPRPPRPRDAPAGQLLARTDQGGENPLQEAQLAEPVNELRFQTNRNGRVELCGTLDPEAGAELLAQLGKLGKPQPQATGLPDPRPIEQRHGDAFAQLVHKVYASRREHGRQPQAASASDSSMPRT